MVAVITGPSEEPKQDSKTESTSTPEEPKMKAPRDGPATEQLLGTPSLFFHWARFFAPKILPFDSSMEMKHEWCSSSRKDLLRRRFIGQSSRVSSGF